MKEFEGDFEDLGLCFDVTTSRHWVQQRVYHSFVADPQFSDTSKSNGTKRLARKLGVEVQHNHVHF